MTIERLTVFDMGIGALYFFASHMVIQTMFYVGLDRTYAEVSIFFLLVIASIVAAHVFARPFQRLRIFGESAFGIPLISTTAAAGAVVALVSLLPEVGVWMFYLAAILLGIACGWITVIWIATVHASKPDASSFYIDGALFAAVIFYFLFRCASSVSPHMEQGFMFALPLIAIVCILRGGAQSSDTSTITLGRAQTLQVLVVVSAVFAIGCSGFVFLAGYGDVLFPILPQ